MVSESHSPLSTEAAHQMLDQFSCLDRPGTSRPGYSLLQQALCVVAKQSDYQIFGICADTLEQGQLTLTSYANALGHPVNAAQIPDVDGPVYIKFNPKSGLLYADSYVGAHRGVLVSCQSAYESGLNEMYGHLPLDLFLAPQ